MALATANLGGGGYTDSRTDQCAGMGVVPSAQLLPMDDSILLRDDVDQEDCIRRGECGTLVR